MIYLLIDLCEKSSALRVIYLIKTAIGIIGMVVPIILIVSLMITAVTAIVKQDDDALKKMQQSAVKKIVAAFIVFLVPTFVDILLTTLNTGTSFNTCYNNATPDYISYRASEEEALKELERQQRSQAAAAKAEQLKREQEQAKQNANNNPAPGASGNGDNSNRVAVTESNVNITRIQTDNLAVPLYYSDHVTVLPSIQFNSQISTQAHNILNNISIYVKNHSSYIPRFETAGAYVGKSGYHGKGLAIDLFNLWSYTKNGKTYYPYGGQGTTTWNQYKTFICEVCNGKEDCEYNINYVIFKNYFEGNGWCWGGNWGPNYFDPMHFELREGNCLTGNKQQVTC